MAKLILVVEDERAVRELMVTLIDDEVDLNATGAGSGFEALELLRTLHFDLVTLDLNMPGGDGNAFLKELKTFAPGVPVIVVTSTPEALSKNPQVKATIKKPFDIDELMDLIKEFSFE